MKKLGKLSINSDKLIKEQELVNLKGGYTGQGCCYCAGHGFLLLISNSSQCAYECSIAFNGAMGFWTC